MGLTPNDLIDRSALGFCNVLAQLYGRAKAICIFAGADDNGALALAIARILTERQYQVRSYLIFARGRVSESCEEQYQYAKEAGVTIHEVNQQFTAPKLEDKELLIDGLFGSDLGYSIEGGLALLINWINEQDKEVISIDLPSGLFADDNSLNKCTAVIRAKHTIAFETPWLPMLLSDYSEFFGAWHIVPLGISPEVHNRFKTQYHRTNSTLISQILLPKGTNNTQYQRGRLLIFGGSSGYYGQIALSCQAALNSGCTAVHLSIAAEAEQTINCITPEVCLSAYSLTDSSDLMQVKGYATIAIGLNYKREHLSPEELYNLCSAYRKPIVLEGEILEYLSTSSSLLSLLPEGSTLIIKPELMPPLFGRQHSDWEYLQMAQEFASQYKLTLVLVGEGLRVIRSSGVVYFSPAGHTDLLKEGMSEGLTALIAGLMARGYDSLRAALLGCYLWGAAGDLYGGRYSTECLGVGRLLQELPQAYRELEQ